MVVCIVEAMKVMNEIKAEQSGVVAEILVENGKPVQFGQALVPVAMIGVGSGQNCPQIPQIYAD